MGTSKIAMISYHTCPLAIQEGYETGGMNTYVLELSKALAKKGLTVDIFTRIKDRTSARIVNLSPTLRVVHLKAGPQEPVPKKQLIKYLPEFVDQFISFNKKERIPYGILHCHYYLSGLAGLMIKKRLKKSPSIVMNFHTLALLKNLVARSIDERENIDRIRAEFLLVKIIDKIIASGDKDKKYMMYLYNCPENKIESISPGVDSATFKPINKNIAKKTISLNPKDNIILFVGRIQPLKGIDDLIYAIKILNQRKLLSNLLLLVIGGQLAKSAELNRLKKLSQTLQVSSKVKFIKQCPHKKLAYYYNAAEVVVLPSYYESFGLVVLEAIACGRPVIITRTSGVVDIIDKKYLDLVISANDPLAIAGKIKRIINEEDDFAKFKKRMLYKIKDLSWHKIADKFFDVYNSLN